MITDREILHDLKQYGIPLMEDHDQDIHSELFDAYRIDHFRNACRLIDEYADKTQLEDHLRIAVFGLTDAQDSTIQNTLITFLAFAISALALYITMSPDVPLKISDWVLVTIFAGSFLILFSVMIAERFRSRKRRFYCAVFEYMLSKEERSA